MDYIIQIEGAIRILVFLFIFAVMAIWELFAPRRELLCPKIERWLANILMTIANTALVRAVVPAIAISAAVLAESNQWGLFHIIDLPTVLVFALCIITLDLVIYGQHLVFHRVPFLWRLHRVHHTDLDFDVTTALRFHPLEILLSLFVKAGAVVVLGAPLEVIIIFEIILNATAIFNHSNVQLPMLLDRGLRQILVTPDMHRVHHSIHDEETNSNFGFSLSCWDRLFGTYNAQPIDGHEDMAIGLKQFREPTNMTFFSLIIQPFRKTVQK